MKHILSVSCLAAVLSSASPVFAGSHQHHAVARSAQSYSSVTTHAASVAHAPHSFAPNSIASRSTNHPLVTHSQFNTQSQSIVRNRPLARPQFNQGFRSNRFVARNNQWRRRHRHWDNDRFIFVGSFGYPYYPFGYSSYDYYPYSYYDSSNYYPYSYDDNSYSDAQPGYDDGSYRGGGSIIIEVQRRLAREGFYKGAIDGVMGSRTHYAIRAYERSHGLTPDGEIGDQLLGAMGLR